MINISKGSDLLPLKSVQALAPKDLKVYNEAAAKFAAEFNEAFPSGKAVKVQIKQITLGERVNIVVEPHPDLSSQVFSFSYEVADRIALNLGCGSADGLVAVTLSTVEPLSFKTTVRAVVTGESYKAGDSVKEYKCPAMVKFLDSREEILLSGDAAAIVAELQRERLRDQIMLSSDRFRKTSKKAAIQSHEPENEEADV